MENSSRTKLWLILFSMVGASFLFSTPVKGDDYEYYYDDYDDDDYEADVSQVGFNPQFTTQSKHVKVDRGSTIRLPCQVDNLGPMVISWLKAGVHGENPKYFATGNIVLEKNQNKRVDLEDVTDKGSVLVITLASDEDVGEYICEVSSQPPARLRHQVSIIVSPKVKILKNPGQEVLRVHAGDEIALVCSGSGDPEPTFRWSRDRRRLPDGRNQIEGRQLIFKNVTRKHSGTYVCEGSNGSGASARDSVKVDVLHSPEMMIEESYIRSDDTVKLELSCIVHASPIAEVTWYRDGKEVFPTSRLSMEVDGKQFILTISDVVEEDRGIYTCRAVNEYGEISENIQVMVRKDDVKFRKNVNFKFPRNNSKLSLSRGSIEDSIITGESRVVSTSSRISSFFLSSTIFIFIPFVFR